MRETKSISRIELKENVDGGIRAVFATLNVIDKDGDVVVPGFVPTGSPVNLAAWGHNWGDLPIGDGRIELTDTEAIFDGAFYLSTPQGDAAYKTMRERVDRGVVNQEWSWGFEVTKFRFGEFAGQNVRFIDEAQVFEVSPVMVGAGIDTRILDIKALSSSKPEELKAALAALTRELKVGRTLSGVNRGTLVSIHTAISDARDALQELLDAADGKPADDEDDEDDDEKAAHAALERAVLVIAQHNHGMIKV